MLLDHIKSDISKSLKTPQLSISIISSPFEDHQIQKEKKCTKQTVFITISSTILLLAIQYSLYPDQLYIEKVDTLGYTRIPGLAFTTLQSVIKYHSLKTQIYCATSDQYLFRKSKSSNKNLYSDVGLLKWWLRVADLDTTKWFFVPGEEFSSVKRLLPKREEPMDKLGEDGSSVKNKYGKELTSVPSNKYGWKYGIGIDAKSKASNLSLFPDDMITKAIEYVDKNSSVKDVMEMMGCLETASGMRGIIVLEFKEKRNQWVTEVQIENFMELNDLFFGFEFDSREKAMDATVEWEGVVPSQCKIIVEESCTNSTEENISSTLQSLENSKTVLNPIIVKRKSEITDLTNLIKKKKV